MEDKRDDARSGLTPREAEMLRWISQGKSNVEIGVTPGINALTVKDHVRKILAGAESHPGSGAGGRAAHPRASRNRGPL